MIGNTASRGGGIAVFGTAGTVVIDRATIRENNAGLGGGIWICADGVSTRIENSLIEFNVSQGDGGGVAAVTNGDGGEVSLVRSTLSGNSAGGNGGGFSANDGGFAGLGIKAEIAQSTFSGNSALFSGGGIFSTFGTTSITESLIEGNLAGWDGGGVAAKKAVVRYSTLRGNTALRNGGGLNLDDFPPAAGRELYILRESGRP